MHIKEQLKEAIQSRSYVIAWVANGLLLLTTLVLSGLYIRQNDLQVPIRYTAFGITNIYRAQWYNEFTFVGLVVLVFIFGSLIGLKLYNIKGGQFATGFMWCLGVVFAILFFMLFAIFRVIAVVE